MTIGNKQKKIRIEKQNQVPDGQGGTKAGVPPYQLRAVVMAHERPMTGREALYAQQLAAILSSVWEIWFRDDISVKDRILVGTRKLEIESFHDPDDTRSELYLLCSEVQA